MISSGASPAAEYTVFDGFTLVQYGRMRAEFDGPGPGEGGTAPGGGGWRLRLYSFVVCGYELLVDHSVSSVRRCTAGVRSGGAVRR